MALRIDRLATLYLVSPLLQLVSENDGAIPILMYHSIADDEESRVNAYYRTTTSPTAFTEQMEYLCQNGYQACSLGEAMGLLESDTRRAVKSVVITFDDGYRDFYGEAFPVLSQFGFSATVFLPTAYIGENTRQFKGRDCLTWSEVLELKKYGISFGSHTVTHPQLRTMDKEAIEKEIVSSKYAIEEKIGSAVESFAYPYAFPQTEGGFKKRLHEMLRCAGYCNGVCTIVGRAGCRSDPFFMERLPVNTLDDRELFRAKLTGAYDWISKSQYVVKMARARAAIICGQRSPPV